ncbi:MAG: tyrosine-type recombinase/integrase [Actinobacteria bacterium]|nr:tyrosine-type recombinase/integrase [Actinomycetota bacterium]
MSFHSPFAIVLSFKNPRTTHCLYFISGRRRFKNQGSISREFFPALEAAGLPRMRFHDLRNTYAALAIEGGADLKSLQAAMGHSSLAVTANVYAHLYETGLERVSKGGGKRPRLGPLRSSACPGKRGEG